MWEDPIVAEVHRAREKLATQLNFDIGAFLADLRKRQAALPVDHSRVPTDILAS